MAVGRLAEQKGHATAVEALDDASYRVTGDLTIKGVTKLPFEMGVAHYDVAPPDVVAGAEDIKSLLAEDRIRFANLLTAWIDVEDGSITGFGQGGESFINTTTVKMGKRVRFTPTAFPTIEPEPEVTDTFVHETSSSESRSLMRSWVIGRGVLAP